MSAGLLFLAVALPLAAQDTVVLPSNSAPVWGRDVRLTRELRIGEVEGAPEYMFGRITSLAVAVDGSIFALDRQAVTVRQYDNRGRFVRSYGREGSGPGELRRPEAIALARNGQLLVRDPGNARIAVFERSGAAAAHWTFPSSFSTNAGMFVDTAGQLLTPLNVRSRTSQARSGRALLRFRADGTVRDTVMWPTWGFQPREMVVTSQGGTARYSVAYDPNVESTYSPLGYFVGGVSVRYAVDQLPADGRVRRIMRAYPRVAVAAAERNSIRDGLLRNIRSANNPNYQWQGPDVATRKPAFTSIAVDLEGRIWVQVPDQSVQRPAGAEGQPPHWTSLVHYDVFQPSGTYLGAVRFPEPFTPIIMRGLQVWGIERDPLGVEYIARYRIGN
ncbi:MAG: hypothetical protein ACRENP_27330 [Longimicrobiales bacterium]